MTTTMKAVAAAASLLSLLAVTVAGDNEGLVNARAGRGMGGGLVKFMMVSQTTESLVTNQLTICFDHVTGLVPVNNSSIW